MTETVVVVVVELQAEVELPAVDTSICWLQVKVYSVEWERFVVQAFEEGIRT